MSNGWHLQFFDGFRAVRGGTSIEHFRDSKAGLLLALLITAPDLGRTREWLADQIWPHTDSETQRARLRWLIHVVRGALSKDLLLNEGNNFVRLAVETTSDLQELETALRRVSLPHVTQDERSALIALLTHFKNKTLLPHVDDDGPVSALMLLRQELLERVQVALEVLCRDLYPASTPAQKDFVGRTVEILEIQQWLRGSGRLLTLTGLGGIGKTRLAQEVLSGREYVLVELADTTDPNSFFDVLRRALRLPRQGEGGARYRIVAHLNAQRSPPLLLLDNLEQFGEQLTPILIDFLQDCPRSRILATSRRPLQAPHEQILLVPPLTRESSVQLFLLRAQRAKPDFYPVGQSLQQIQEICNQLQGLALSIELTAARITLLSPAQILKQLQVQLEFLRTTRPNWSERHRSQQAALQWSYTLLPEFAQRALRTLSIFRGQFSLEGAQWVYGSQRVLDALEQLELNSLITIQESDDSDSNRFSFLVVVREFGIRCLADSERQETEARHTSYVVNQVKVHASARPTSGWEEAVCVIHQERANLSDVIHRAIENKDTDTLTTLVECTAYLYSELGLWNDLLNLLKATQITFTDATSPALRSYILGLRAALSRRTGDGETAWYCWQEKLKIQLLQSESASIVPTLIEMLCQAIDERRLPEAEEALRQLVPRLENYPPDDIVRVVYRVHQVRYLEATGETQQALVDAKHLLTEFDFSHWDYLIPLYYLAPALRRLQETSQAETLIQQGLQHALDKNLVFFVGVFGLEFGYIRETQHRFVEAGLAFLVARELHERLDTRLKTESRQALTRFFENPNIPEITKQQVRESNQELSSQSSDTLIRTFLLSKVNL